MDSPLTPDSKVSAFREEGRRMIWKWQWLEKKTSTQTQAQWYVSHNLREMQEKH